MDLLGVEGAIAGEQGTGRTLLSELSTHTRHDSIPLARGRSTLLAVAGRRGLAYHDSDAAKGALVHEMSIAMSLREQVLQFLPTEARLREVHIEVGALEHLDEVVMRTAWEALNEGTPLAGSRLCMASVPLRVRCRACQHEHEPEHPALLVCPACEAARPEVLGGNGVLLRSLEVDEDAGEADPREAPEKPDEAPA